MQLDLFDFIYYESIGRFPTKDEKDNLFNQP
jgi:hypothetical protein